MEEFNSMLEERQGEICGDIFDLLLSLSEFGEFKDLMLSFKAHSSHAEGANKAAAAFVYMAPIVTPCSSQGMVLHISNTVAD